MELTIGDTKEILKDYDLAEPISVKLLTSGYANINFRLDTTKGPVLLRFCKNKKVEEINYELSVMRVLKANNYPSAYPIERKDGKYITKTPRGNVVLYEYIEGEEPKPNTNTVKEAARATALLSIIPNWESLEQENPCGSTLCREVMTNLNTASEDLQELVEFFKKEDAFFNGKIGNNLPRGFVHGDMFPDNTKFKGDKLLAVLDFEEICTDELLFDIAATINGFCFANNVLDLKLVDVFIEEYEKIRKLTQEEKNHLMIYIRWIGHIMMAWHLSNLLKERDEKKIKRAYFYKQRAENLERL
jgi:homoserine kinase type II